LAKTQPIVSPDGTQVAYVVNKILKNGLESSVWIAGTDGTNPKQASPSYPGKDSTLPKNVTFLGLVYVNLCGWSVDGQQIAYIVRGESWGESSLLFVIDVFARQVTRVEADNVLSAAWSPRDPDLLVVNQFATPYLVNVNTGQQEKINELDDKDISTGWMPDSQHLYIVVADRAIHPAEKNGIIIFDLRTRTSQWLEVGWVRNAQWSPDGSKIAYTRTILDSKIPDGTSLLVIDSNGENEKVLVGQDVVDMRYGLFCWSADSRWIVGLGSHPNNPQVANLYLVNAETAEMAMWVENIPAPSGMRMIWCYESWCVNGGYQD